MKITVKIDASGAFAKLEAAAKQVAYAQAVALTRTAQIVKTDLRAEMQKVFSSATNFTLSSLYVKAATQSDPVAIVGVRAGGRSSAANWLLPEIEGGPRPSGIEVFLRPLGLPPAGTYAVPGSEAPMTGSGKLSISALRRIVSQMQANPQDAGAMLKRRRTARRVDYFALTQSLGALKPGIYGRRGHEILPIVIFVARPQYRKKFNFYGVARRSAEKNFPTQFKLALANALRTAR